MEFLKEDVKFKLEECESEEGFVRIIKNKDTVNGAKIHCVIFMSQWS